MLILSALVSLSSLLPPRITLCSVAAVIPWLISSLHLSSPTPCISTSWSCTRAAFLHVPQSYACCCRLQSWVLHSKPRFESTLHDYLPHYSHLAMRESIIHPASVGLAQTCSKHVHFLVHVGGNYLVHKSWNPKVFRWLSLMIVFPSACPGYTQGKNAQIFAACICATVFGNPYTLENCQEHTCL